MSRELVDSGVKWIGKIPKEWKIKKLKYLTHIQTGNTPSKEKQNVYYSNEDGIKWVKADNLGSSIDIRETTEYLTTEGIKQGRLFPKNSIYVCCIASIGKTGFITDQASCNQQINSLDFYNAYWKYGYYLTLAQENEYFLNATGNVVKILNSERQGNIICPFPSLIEQEKIANYLDNKISKIEQTIEDNKKEIELLKEYKINLISKIIKEDEENLNIIKLKFLGDLQNGISAGAEKFGTGNEIFINYGDVYNNFEIPENPVGKIYLTDKEKETYSLKKGDVLFTRTSETIEEVGMTSVCMKDYPNSAYSGFVIRFRPNKENLLYEGYSKYYFKMREHRDYFAREMNLVTRASLSQGLLNNLVVILPDFNKQIEIFNILDKKFELLNKSIEYRQQIINKLEEYKKSLIYEVITGKKEV